MAKRKKVFLSYAYQDLAVVEKAVEILKQRGVIGGDEVVFYPASEPIESGVSVRKAIKEKMISADKVVVFSTSASATSATANYEVGMADALEKPMVVVKFKTKGESFNLANEELIEADFIEVDEEG